MTEIIGFSLRSNRFGERMGRHGLLPVLPIPSKMSPIQILSTNIFYRYAAYFIIFDILQLEN